MYRKTAWSSRKPEDFYVCQISDPSKVEEWTASQNTLDINTPERHWCAMCCVRSLLLAERLPAPSVEELFERACKQEVYRQDPDIGWRGAYHLELANFINTVRTVERRKARAARSMTFAATPNNRWSNMEDLVRSGCYVILSVHPSIRLRTAPLPVSRRGHFVLVYDFFEENGHKFFLINNPAGYQSQNSQVGMEVSADRLQHLSSGDGVVVKSRFARLIGE